MSNLWIKAVIDGTDYGVPPEDYVREVKHDYLRKHYDDPDYNDPDVIANKKMHDHFDGKGQYQARCSTDARNCTHPATDKKMREYAQSNWDASHRQLLDPEAHEKAMSSRPGFLTDYALDHPDRSFKWNADGSLGESNDPRLSGH